MALGSLIRRPQRDFGGPGGGLSWPDYLRLWEQFGFNGVQYMTPMGGIAELTADQAFRNPIVLRCVIIRASVFAEIRFKFRDRHGGAGSRKLFGSPALEILEQPWPGAATGHLLAQAEVDASRYGNSYWKLDPAAGMVWIDPLKMHLITGDVDGPTGNPYGRRLLAYQTQSRNGQPEETFLPSEILHYRPIPDPTHPFRGLSWFSALLPDITSDTDMTTFKSSFVRNAAVPGLVFVMPPNINQDAFNALHDRVETSHTGPQAGFKNLYVGGGVDVKVVGSSFRDMEMYSTQSYGETRLSVAAGVPAALLGIAEGLRGQTLNTANYAAARRNLADVTLRPLWTNFCAAASSIVKPPPGAELWYDDRDVAFLEADMIDAATQRQADSATIASLVNAGYTPDSVVEAVNTADWTALKHTGLYSVQLQPPGELGEPGGPTTAPTDTPAEPAPAPA
ncbi:MAG: phage portal protein [Candidatus Dormibacteria bacterium]